MQTKLAVPFSIGLILNNLIGIISLSFVGHLGTEDLAAAALATTLYTVGGWPSQCISLASACGCAHTLHCHVADKVLLSHATYSLAPDGCQGPAGQHVSS